jgi:hypothetical protein
VRARVNKGKRSSESVLHSISPASIFWWDAVLRVCRNGVIMRPYGWSIWMMHRECGRPSLECRKGKK